MALLKRRFCPSEFPTVVDHPNSIHEGNVSSHLLRNQDIQAVKRHFSPRRDEMFEPRLNFSLLKLGTHSTDLEARGTAPDDSARRTTSQR